MKAVQTVGYQAQVPTLQRWDNPVPMPCDHFITRGVGGAYLGLHADYCGSDCVWVYVSGGDVIAFRCHNHKHSSPDGDNG